MKKRDWALTREFVQCAFGLIIIRPLGGTNGFSRDRRVRAERRDFKKNVGGHALTETPYRGHDYRNMFIINCVS